MPDRCSCGAQLAADALFCHKCGRPQRDLPAADFVPPAGPAPLPAARPAPEAVQLGISFRNRGAVRAAMLSAATASLLMLFPMPTLAAAFWMLLWLVVAGFAAVWLYHRRTGEFLSVGGGARIGWITGVFCFLIAFVLFVINMIVVSREGGLAEVYRSRGEVSPQVEEALRMLESPGGMVALLGFTLMILFLMFTGLPTLGGVIGAKVLEKE